MQIQLCFRGNNHMTYALNINFSLYLAIISTSVLRIQGTYPKEDECSPSNPRIQETRHLCMNPMFVGVVGQLESEHNQSEIFWKIREQM